jgi:translation initiation factor IF-1
MSGDVLSFEGTVTAAHKGDVFSINVMVGDVTRPVLARRCGRMRHNKIRLLVGDRVVVEASPYDPSRGRITQRIDPVR